MDQAVTVTFVPEQVITWIIVGLIAGSLAGMLIRGRRFGFVGSVIVGLVGALFGGFLFSALGVQIPVSGGLTLNWADMLIAFIGAAIILILFGGIYRTRYYR